MILLLNLQNVLPFSNIILYIPKALLCVIITIIVSWSLDIFMVTYVPSHNVSIDMIYSKRHACVSIIYRNWYKPLCYLYKIE